MSLVEEILEHNKIFVANKEYTAYTTSSNAPQKKMVIISCMDSRLTELLPKALGIKNGDAKMVKLAGALLSYPFGGAMRSIIVAIHELGAEEIFVIGHHDCGMSKVDYEEFEEVMISNGISEDTLDVLNNAGFRLKKWLEGFSCVSDSVKNTVELVKNHPLVPSHVSVHGFVIDPQTGKLDKLT